MVPNSCALVMSRTPLPLDIRVLGPSAFRLATTGALGTGKKKMAVSQVLIEVSSRFKNCWKAQLIRKTLGCVEMA